jgi:hypothetical protein
MQTRIQRRSLWTIIQPTLTATLLLCTPFFCACTRYVYVESSIATDRLPSPTKEITETNQFKSIAPKVVKVALKAPDYCSGQAASMNDKQANATRSLIKSECGVEMGALERKLIDEGYTVYSWKIVDSIMKSQSKPPLLAIKEMGAEVLFTVNALEGIVASNDDLIRRSFFWSSREGNKGVPAELAEGHRQAIRQAAKPYETKLRSSSFGAFLDVTAVDVATGQAIWFYKSGKYDIKRAETPVTLVLTVKKNNWKVYMVDGIIPVRQNTSASYEYGSTGTPPQLQSSDKYYDKYVRDVVADFVDTFKASRK